MAAPQTKAPPKTGPFDGEIDIPKSLTALGERMPDENQQIAWLYRQLTIVTPIYRLPGGREIRDLKFTRENLKKMLRALGEDV